MTTQPTRTFAAPADAPRHRSLVLSGGGMRLSYQAGVLRALQEAGLSFQHIDATSGGAINLAMLLSGLSPTEMGERWTSLQLRRSLSLMPLESYLRQDRQVAMGSAEAFIDYVYPHLGIDLATVRGAQWLQGTFNVFNYTRKVNEVIAHQDLVQELFVAGMSLPGVMPPVEWNGSVYLDSAFARDANLMEAVRRGAEEIWLVWCLGNSAEYRGGALRIYVQMLEMAANASLNREFDDIAQLNTRIAAGDSPYGQRSPIRVHVIRPPHPLPLDTDLYLGRTNARALIGMGYVDAQRYLATTTDEGDALNPETVMMTTAVPGISFQETMQGNFALGATEPDAGAAAGKAVGTTLAIHVTVTVRDLDRFVQDPNHNGTLAGTVDFAPLGLAMPTGEGIFRLFAPADAADTTLMVYELPFERAGQTYYLAGAKHVHDDPGFDLWSDTTTLYTRLYEGTDTTGPVVGAGVLRLDAVAFAKVAASVRAVDASSPVEAAKLIAQFGGFFARELWKSYAPAAFK